MTIETLGHIIEAILFVTGEAVEIQALSKGLESTELEVIQALDYLTEDMDRNNRGVCIKRFGSQAQLTTRAEWAPYIEKMLQPVQKQSLSQAALETLSIVAYKQPVTKLEVEAIRGVKCDYSIQSLVSKDLIEEVGRKETLGRPILYGTTEHFLSHFGLGSIADLPEKPDGDDEQEGEDLVP